MAKQIESDKGFLVLQVDKEDLGKINSPGICDWCNDYTQSGKYIAVLNHIYCDKCYQEWHQQAKYYKSDRRIELKNFNFYRRMFNENEDNPQLNI